MSAMNLAQWKKPEDKARMSKERQNSRIEKGRGCSHFCGFVF
jgi:hypothetical protein